jgi:hypothetical protein
MPPLRKRDNKGAEMMEVNMRATPSPDTIEMPMVTHPVYGQYRPASQQSRDSRNYNYSRPYTGNYSNISQSTLALDAPQTPHNMLNPQLPSFAPRNEQSYRQQSYGPPFYGPPSYDPSPVGTRSSSPYPASRSPFVSPSTGLHS